MQGHVRFAVANEQGIPITWGGNVGCSLDPPARRSCHCRVDVRIPAAELRAGRSQADHTVEYARGGLTDPANGGPQCRRHNNAKNEGFTVWRDPMGAWHTYRPDGTEIP